MTTHRRTTAMVVCLLAAGTVGCATSRSLPDSTDAGGLVPVDGGGLVAVDAGGPGDAGAPTPLDAAPAVPPGASCPRAVDLLFMVDNSNSMAEEQNSLVVQLPRLVRGITTGDRDGDGTPEAPPVGDLHVGVVTTDMGNGGHPVPSCASQFGDDGVLLTRGDATHAECGATYPEFTAFAPPDDVDAFATEVGCVARVGTGGCGFEQPLEAVLKALTPSTAPIVFAGGTTGHADRENAGFLRPESIVVTILVTDEDDCSLADVDVLDPSSAVYTTDLNLRCFSYPTAVHEVARYVEGLRAVRASDPGLFVFAAIAGVPGDLVADPGAIDYGAILGDDRMQERLDTSSSYARLQPSCNVPGRGLAFPPRRLVHVARALGPQSIVQSICQDDFGPVVDAVHARIGAILRDRC